MIRPLRLPFVAATALALVGAGCLVPPEAPPEKATPVQTSPPLPPGSYEIQSISYDDADGAYRVFLLNAPPSHRGAYVTLDLRMARLTDEESAAGKTSARLDVDAGAALVAEATSPPEGATPSAAPARVDPVAVLPASFAIQYTHNVVEEHGGQQVVVRQEASTWSPFMSAMTGVMVGNMLFGPRYYYPPPYVGGGAALVGGVGGATKAAAAQTYTSQHGKAPQPTRLASSGYAKAPSSSFKSTGKGAGASKLGAPTKSAPRAPKRSFGGGGFGRRR